VTLAADEAGPGPGPAPHDAGSDDLAHLRALVESERVVGSEAEINDALDGLAALLLDVAQDQGSLPTHPSPTIWPDARNARGPDPPQLGAVGT
jgi:hypothetical protein